MTGSAALDGLLLAALLVAVAVSAVGLLRGRSVDRYLTTPSAETGHLVMNVVMVAMLTPWWGGALRTAGVVVLAVLALGFGALLVRGSPSRPAHLFHLVAAGAMLFAVLTTDHDHLTMTMAVTAPAWQSTVAWVLAATFLLDAVLTTGLVALAPRTALAGAPATASTVRTLRVASVPHVVMDLGMVAMLAMAA
ncbi:hypothetical protein GCM10023201_22260 [Actinomycetospora corticicola]|uniref:DUF5134 domain-containing protein n=1 Tax=Actinomycetospora corticicola TaxID=663602 RepID=A0A7Y9DRA6_9PSEU|nr:hypothetical protein [Actinomycetospora corticicola]